MWIKPRYGCFVMTDNTTFLDVSALFIDKDDKTIDVIDELEHSVGLIYYENIKDVSINKYGEDGRLTGDIQTIVVNGEFTNNLG